MEDVWWNCIDHGDSYSQFSSEHQLGSGEYRTYQHSCLKNMSLARSRCRQGYTARFVQYSRGFFLWEGEYHIVFVYTRLVRLHLIVSVDRS